MKAVHGTCVAIGEGALLLRGPPGSGKSDLALRLIEQGARLVTDDRVLLRGDRGKLHAFAPAALTGKVEARGIGVLTVPFVRTARLIMVVGLVAGTAVPRLPEPATCTYEGGVLGVLALAPFEASTPAKLRLALARAPAPIPASA
jgi:serine kinase of HPr protein (carbohydrate metabolism regulator)